MARAKLSLVRGHPQSYDVLVANLPATLAAVREESNEAQRRLQHRHALAGLVFAYWVARFDKPRALLDAKRERLLFARLVECGDQVSDLLWALDGARKDRWVMGQAPSSTRKVDALDYLLADRAQLERFAELCPEFQQGEPHPMAVKYGVDTICLD